MLMKFRDTRSEHLVRGQLTEVELPGDQRLSYFAYRPVAARTGQPLLVFIHGYARRAEDHARALLPLCERLGCTLLAPHFTKDEHPRYQRLGRGHDGQRADRVLNACIEHLDGAATPPIYLAGFSGGAQFAHRYAMAHPQRVARLIAVAAGWYTLPDSTQRYPQGLRTQRTLRGYSLNPEQFLRIPTSVLVGSEDTGSHNLRRTPDLDTRQGRTRVERARNWVAHMRLAARDHRLPSVVDYLEVPGVGHDFAEFIERGRLLELMDWALRDPTQQAGLRSVTPAGIIPAYAAAHGGKDYHVCA
jgi:pimeloyl-ACP methyl ester carboxylesterase